MHTLGSDYNVLLQRTQSYIMQYFQGKLGWIRNTMVGGLHSRFQLKLIYSQYWLSIGGKVMVELPIGGKVMVELPVGGKVMVEFRVV